MARHKKSTSATQSDQDRHAAYAALMARLTAFQSEISAQAKSRATADVPEATLGMAVDLMAQMARLMARAIEARGLPALSAGRPVSFSQAAIAFTQAHQAFAAFGRRKGFDKPVPDAEAIAQEKKDREEIAQILNKFILSGIQHGLFCAMPEEDPEREAERRELSNAHKALVERMEAFLGYEIEVDGDWGFL